MEENKKDILFLVENGPSFLLGKVESMLDNEEILYDQSNFSIQMIEKIEKLPPVIIVEAEILAEEHKDRVYLYDRCIEQGARLVLIGPDDVMDRLMAVTAESLIAAKFIRPVNAKEVTQCIKELLRQVEERKRQKKILVVDDSPMFLRTVSEWLEAKYQVFVCPSAAAAFQMISANRPDLILLDYEMPVCSGAQFMEMLQTDERVSDIPIIFLTSKNDQETVKQVLALKPKGYLLKTQAKESIVEFIGKFFSEQAATMEGK